MKKSFSSHTLLAAAAVVALGTVAVGANADTISGTQTALTSASGTAVNLTTQGGVDWIYYDGTSDTAGTFQQKAVATPSITKPAITTTATSGGNSKLQFNVGFPASFSWTDGASMATGSNSTGYGRLIGGGSFTFTATPDGNAQTLTVYGGGFAPKSVTATVTDTYSLANVATPVALTNTFTGGASAGTGGDWYDTINFQAAATDPLTVTIASSNATVSLAGATLADAAPTPEPASLGLLGIGGAAMLLISRRKRA